MGDIDDFESVFGSSPNVAYDEDTRVKIIYNRQSLENELFIDRLLKALGVNDVRASYPPKSNHDLRKLYDEIMSSTSPDHHRHSIIYYLLKDISKPHDRAAENLAKSWYLPNRYKMYLDGIWFLDRLQFERALGFLTEPALLPTFPEEILYTLCQHAPSNDISLPVAYFQTVSPTITSSRVLESYFLILCGVSIAEAFYFSRAQDEPNHRLLFIKLVIFVHKESRGKMRAMRGVALISLPFDEMEESWFTDLLTKGRGSRLPGAGDSLSMREKATGLARTAGARRSSKSSELHNGLNWDNLNSGG